MGYNLYPVYYVVKRAVALVQKILSHSAVINVKKPDVALNTAMAVQIYSVILY
jgi:hypothetical protein